MPPAYRAIIADDEQPLRRSLKTQLEHAWPELTICGEAQNGIQALELIKDLQPHIAFLDIKMPGMTGMQVAREAGQLCWIVFITAFDQFAVQAFENEAVDYLLKPVDPQRLAQTVSRLKHRCANRTPDPTRMDAVLQTLEAHLSASQPSAHLKWIKVTHKQSMRLIPVEEIGCFQAQDKYTVVYTPEDEFLIRKPIKELVAELNPDMFWQIHRSTIVNAAWIDQVSSSITGRYVLTLKEIEGTFTVSRSFRHRFKSM